ncbi:uncharacterized protein [Malus domestica]|uniref:uncharacterized protein n=1 Tax=Malus domestica TaxID=3750 RepID=UPI0039759289
MTNLAKLEYATLDITGKNYLTWGRKQLIFSKSGEGYDLYSRHLDEALKSEYLTVEDPLALWEALRSRYNHQTTVILPKARYEWSHLRIQDFKSVVEYNSALFRITSQMKLCGDTITDEILLEKTYGTFHANNVLLQQQYRARGYTEYNQLISVLLVAEQNNELLMKNHNSRPTGSAPFPEVNDASLEVNATSSGGNYYKQGRGHNEVDGIGKARTMVVSFTTRFRGIILARASNM